MEKIIKKYRSSQKRLNKIQRELKVLSKAIKNKNIIRFFRNVDGKIWLVNKNNRIYQANKLISDDTSEDLIKSLTELNNIIIDQKSPIIDTYIKEINCQFVAVLSPISQKPIFIFSKVIKTERV